ncbi:hypothetical protein TRVA0_006S01596 [Trichomonascus vanleenenianus]|uniref:uncharacterized protein n=1 Tax=Trichomonascus vanleenenianus TaxID=2268995 RepID=UPI003ECAEC06
MTNAENQMEAYLPHSSHSSYIAVPQQYRHQHQPQPHPQPHHYWYQNTTPVRVDGGVEAEAIHRFYHYYTTQLDSLSAMATIARSYLANRTSPHCTTHLPTVLNLLEVWSHAILKKLYPTLPEQLSTHIPINDALLLEITNRVYTLPQTRAREAVLDGYLVASCISHITGDVPRAYLLNKQLLSLYPGHIQAMSNMAIICRTLGRKAEVEYYWSEVIMRKPLYTDAIEQLITLLCAQNRHKDAIVHVIRVMTSIADYSQPGTDHWFRFLSLGHTLGNLQSSVGNLGQAARIFTSIVLWATGFHSHTTVDDIIQGGNEAYLGVGDSPNIAVSSEGGQLSQFIRFVENGIRRTSPTGKDMLVGPKEALNCKSYVFSASMLFPGSVSLDYQTTNYPPSNHHQRQEQKASVQKLSTKSVLSSVMALISNVLLNLAKIIQDGMRSGAPGKVIYIDGALPPHLNVLSLYLLSHSFNPSPSTANNIGILLAAYSHIADTTTSKQTDPNLPPESESSRSRRLAIEYYTYGISLDSRHPHLYTNLGSLYREQGSLQLAIRVYEKAVNCNPNFSMALTNMASTLKDMRHIELAVQYYRRAVEASPDFAEALCGLAVSQSHLCDWNGRGGYGSEEFSVDDSGRLVHGHVDGWLARSLRLLEEQLETSRQWGVGLIDREGDKIAKQCAKAMGVAVSECITQLSKWHNQPNEGKRVVGLIEKAMRACQRRWYLDRLHNKSFEIQDSEEYERPKIPSALPVPPATTLFPFQAFTLPVDSTQMREMSECAAYRVSMATLTSSWMPKTVYPPPPPPTPALVVGYVSSDFVNHPLAHLMQSIFGFHDRRKVLPICYSMSQDDGSEYRSKIQRESYKFRDVSSLSTQQIAEQISRDGCHILVNFNGYTRGARNELFAARLAPVQISVMGYPSPLASKWNDYILADRVAVGGNTETYVEQIIYMPRSFFCCDHRQSSMDSKLMRSSKDSHTRRSGLGTFVDEVLRCKDHTWETELELRHHLRTRLFPDLPPGAFLMGNFNQMYKILPATLKIWIDIMKRQPNAYLWILQFPETGAVNIKKYAQLWGGDEIASRVILTPVAGKELHIFRSRVCDLFLDTPECNGHTTASDVIWSCTPIITYPRHGFKLCSRIAASIIHAAFPDTDEGREMANLLVVNSDQEYKDRAVELAKNANGILLNMRKMLFEQRETGEFFDTKAWVYHVEKGYKIAWDNWIDDIDEPIYL